MPKVTLVRYECHCGYRAARKEHLTRHQAYKHNIGVTWHVCEEPNCTYRAKQKFQLARHLAAQHNINVTWHECDVEGCDYRAKERGTLASHQSNRHNLNVTWHLCDACPYRCKTGKQLRSHKLRKHNAAKEIATLREKNDHLKTRIVMLEKQLKAAESKIQNWKEIFAGSSHDGVLHAGSVDCSSATK